MSAFSKFVKHSISSLHWVTCNSINVEKQKSDHVDLKNTLTLDPVLGVVPFNT